MADTAKKLTPDERRWAIYVIQNNSSGFVAANLLSKLDPAPQTSGAPEHAHYARIVDVYETIKAGQPIKEEQKVIAALLTEKQGDHSVVDMIDKSIASNNKFFEREKRVSNIKLPLDMQVTADALLRFTPAGDRSAWLPDILRQMEPEELASDTNPILRAVALNKIEKSIQQLAVLPDMVGGYPSYTEVFAKAGATLTRVAQGAMVTHQEAELASSLLKRSELIPRDDLLLHFKENDPFAHNTTRTINELQPAAYHFGRLFSSADEVKKALGAHAEHNKRRRASAAEHHHVLKPHETAFSLPTFQERLFSAVTYAKWLPYSIEEKPVRMAELEFEGQHMLEKRQHILTALKAEMKARGITSACFPNETAWLNDPESADWSLQLRLSEQDYKKAVLATTHGDLLLRLKPGFSYDVPDGTTAKVRINANGDYDCPVPQPLLKPMIALFQHERVKIKAHRPEPENGFVVLTIGKAMYDEKIQPVIDGYEQQVATTTMQRQAQEQAFDAEEPARVAAQKKAKEARDAQRVEEWKAHRDATTPPPGDEEPPLRPAEAPEVEPPLPPMDENPNRELPTARAKLPISNRSPRLAMR